MKNIFIVEMSSTTTRQTNQPTTVKTFGCRPAVTIIHFRLKSPTSGGNLIKPLLHWIEVVGVTVWENTVPECLLACFGWGPGRAWVRKRFQPYMVLCGRLGGGVGVWRGAQIGILPVHLWRLHCIMFKLSNMNGVGCKALQSKITCVR